MLTDLSVKDFISTTASGEPVPGGGSISALCGSLAAALGAMVSRLTIGRVKFADREADMKVLLSDLESVGRELTLSIDRDSQAYATVMAAYKLPKSTDEEKKIRKEEIQVATRGAAEVPMQVARLTASILPKLESVAQMGNPNAVTDAAVAIMCARTAILGALLNVEINLSSLNDVDFVAAMRLEAASLRIEAKEAERKVLRHVDDQINPSLI